MILLFDMGNTSCKWQLIAADAVLAEGRDFDVDCMPIDSFVSALNSIEGMYGNTCERVSRILVSSVASDDRNQRLCDYLHPVFIVEPEFVGVQKFFAGVEAAYDDLPSLGVDRWLAVIAAYNEFKSPCVIVDAGTAITIDVVAADGQHLGGMIAPGLKLISDALCSRTAKVRFGSVIYSPDSELGRSTHDCVALGVSMMVEGFVAQALKRLRAESSIVIWSGGDGKKILNTYPSDLDDVCHYFRGSLVFDGLRVWADVMMRSS